MRTVTSTTSGLSGRADQRPSVRPAVEADPAFDEALARIRELTGRLHAVLDLHDARRTLLRGHVCRDCGQAFPCPTVRASRAA